MKRLVINSDDFGMCHSANEGILRGFREIRQIETSERETASA